MTREEFKTKWISVFCKNITEEQMKDFCVDRGQYSSFLWHIFSFEIAPRLRGKKARQEYDKVDKEGAFEIHYDPNAGLDKFNDAETKELSLNHMTSQQIRNDKMDYGYCMGRLNEFYVVGKDFSWCYIVTHEDDYGCGPYFCYAPE
jgi:hypothetical protein